MTELVISKNQFKIDCVTVCAPVCVCVCICVYVPLCVCPLTTYLKCVWFYPTKSVPEVEELKN